MSTSIALHTEVAARPFQRQTHRSKLELDSRIAYERD